MDGSIGERVKQLRTYLDMSQTEFGQRLGISRDAVVNIEGGRLKNMEQKAPVFQLMATEFNCSLTWLRTGEGDMFPPKTMEDTLSELFDEVAGEREDSFRKQVFLGMARLDAKDWAVIAQLVRKMLGKDTEEK